MNLAFFLFVGFTFVASGPQGFSFSKNDTSLASEESQLISSNCTFLTKRVWVICSDPRYLSNGNSLSIQTKDNLFSEEEEPSLMVTSETWQGGFFFYSDIAKTTECFRVDSTNNSGDIVIHTDWVCRIEPSLVYEITPDVSANIRSRTTDVESTRHPDAKILGLLLSSYISFDPGYENGFGAFPELEAAWLSKYIGKYGSITGPDLSETFIFDYTKEEYENRLLDDQKTRIISVSQKIDELSDAYSSYKPLPRLTDKRDSIISLLVLCFCTILCGALIFIVSKIDKKYGTTTNQK